ncbi:YbaN family protein [Dysgonomonas sp. Marseille-P4677]|uniref:YbaN family protein n=1 Tax=Dysgonomonas sp. Marseille-P4677 TaxID=2364790 RepID=UPI001911E682|nr:YbaN family protein [Dysgonomonas sp. Marseille-P4677]MBK5721295.1 YbaN family protein [Dysgonomonas sp. Marseille-P4677]
MIRYLYIILGLITLSLGLLGIITPGLPTTPFILLTAVLFAKGSPRLHKKLMDNKVTGKYIKRVNEGFSLKGLAISIGLMWCMIFFTAFVVFNYGTMRFVMIGLGVIGTIAQIIVLRKKRKRAALIRIETEKDNIENRNNLKAS